MLLLVFIAAAFALTSLGVVPDVIRLARCVSDPSRLSQRAVRRRTERVW
jgi:hypothetical protein